ncbi:MAG: hypothetical protein QG656_555 [Candidatus Hydrogenedentes bacterium]|nr:hypothetical protein [Candidatus Hydrogenedentota bacterium]
MNDELIRQMAVETGAGGALGGMTMGWLLVTLVESCVGGAMLLYGWKQKKPEPLVAGIVLSAVPYITRDAWLAALLGAGVIGILIAVKKAS